MTAGQPLVSIVTPSYNQARFLEDAMQSVLSQDYPNIEYLVIDGGSTDGSLAIIERYADRLAHWTSEPDRGQAEAINKGLQRATGEIVAWLNSDDVYLPGAIRSAVAALQARPDAGMVCADGLMVDENLLLLDRHYYGAPTPLDLLCFEVILQPTVFMRREILEAVGLLDSRYNLILDHELWVRITRAAPAIHVREFWALERTHAEAKTIAQAGQFVEEARRLIEWAESSPDLAETVENGRRKIDAGFHVFAARRLIDSARYSTAMRHLASALRLHPPTVMRYWYKVIQAGFSALGLAPLFLGYRRLRRRLQHRGRRIEPISGAALMTSEDVTAIRGEP